MMKEFWDRNIPEDQVKAILKDDSHERFIELAALLLLRSNEPKKVFSLYFDRVLFAKNWARIKKQMNKDEWGSRRIVFWQAIYEKLLEQLKSQGMSFRHPQQKPRAEICRHVGQLIKSRRQNKQLTQKELAQKLGISQQIISQIEKGKQNVSLLTLQGVISGTGGRLVIKVKDA